MDVCHTGASPHRELPHDPRKRGAMENFPMPLALINSAGSRLRVVSATESFLDRLGLPRASVEGSDLAEVFLAEAFSRTSDAIRRCLETCRTIRVQVARRTAQDEFYDLVAHPLADLGSGELVALILEAPLRQPNLTAQRQALLDHISPLSPSMFYVYDLASMRTRYIHRELAETLGLSPDGVDLVEVLSQVHPDDQQILSQHVEQMARLTDGETAEAVVRIRAPAGEYLWVRSRCRVLRRSRAGVPRLIVGAASDVTEQRRQAEELETASRALAQAEIEERRRVGRELHDSTAQHLLAVDLSLTAMERRNAFSPTDQATLRELRGALSAARQEIRTLAYMLHPPSLESKGLPAAMKAFADGFGRRTALDIAMTADRDLRLSAPVEHALFRIFQEALMNVHRHTAATRVRCAMGAENGFVWLDVEDNGKQLGELPFNPDQEAGVGIAGMRARLTPLGGRLLLRRGASGFLVRAEAPVNGV